MPDTSAHEATAPPPPTATAPDQQQDAAPAAVTLTPLGTDEAPVCADGVCAL